LLASKIITYFSPMVRLSYSLFFFLLCLCSCVADKNLSGLKTGGNRKGPVIEEGVSKALAEYRKKVISGVSYELELDIPALRNEKIMAAEVITFQLKSTVYPLQLDFREETQKIKAVRVNDKDISVQHQLEHLIVAPEHLIRGENKIELRFEAGEGALNRNADYLYTLFVPDRARTVFPCFDQPDLKATYKLSLTIPSDWKAIANGALKDSVNLTGRKTYHYATSDTLSTYLFAFAAGKFDRATAELRTGDWAEYLYRETDTGKIKPSVKEAFDIHRSSLQFLEDWTGIPYPFQKFGFVAIPDFQFGGMEHPGAIQYKASAMFLDAGATKDQINARNNVIAHETAHMWFGDLVTMNWFTDVWMKEVFANFMADKSSEKLSGKEVFDLKFLVDHFPAAYGIDRTTGSNPIRQDLDNLKDAGTLYGNIIYHKAPIMMRQLERLMGKEKFQLGVREYLSRFANGNASWPDLVGILDKYADADLQKWNKVWVEDTGRPVIDYAVENKGGKISRFVIRQKAEYGPDRVWPQLFEVKFYYPDHSKEITVALNGKEADLKEAIGMEVPDFVQFNSSGQGYGLWPVDAGMLSGLYGMQSPLNRASAYISLYENMLTGRTVRPRQLLDLLAKGLSQEKEELNIKLMSGYLSVIFWEFISPEERAALSSGLENTIWQALEDQKLPNIRKLLFKTYQDVFLSESARKKLYDIWSSQQSVEGFKLTEDDYTSLAFSLALRDDKDTDILKKQLLRITNADRKKRFEFIMPALSPLSSERDQFFKSLEQRSNREKESNVGTALMYLHHPLRQSTSIKYLTKSLELLAEIQVTGDIFFPQNWLQSTFGYYQSPEAAGYIRQFLQQHPAYNPKLKTKVLQSADNLFKAEQLLKK
jgi:aminopeptidase N